MARRTVTLVALLLLTGTPLVGAWSSKGSFEPSTERDTLDGYMFSETDTNPDQGVRMVYFNGFVTDGSAVITATSPNSALLQTGILTTSTVPWVMLGVWKDCNGDGYIGTFDNVGYEYPSALLSGNTCPALTSKHNDGQWVREFLPIRWPTNPSGAATDTFGFVDREARVWADAGLPEDTTDLACTLFPQPAGTFHSTGGVLAWADCQDAYKVTGLINSAATATGLSQLSFADRPNGDQGSSSSLLNRPFGFGESSDPSLVKAADCSNPIARTPTAISDPTDPGDGSGVLHNPTGTRKLTNDKGEIVSLPAGGGVSVPSVNPSTDASGSFLGTMNETLSAAGDSCDRSDGSGAADNFYCPDHNVFVDAILLCEMPPAAGWTGRTRPDALLFSADSGRGNYTTNGYLYFLGGAVNLFWQTFDNVENKPLVANDLNPKPVAHWTFYGYVSPPAVSSNGLTLKASTTAAYGAEPCALTLLDSLTRFNCDGSKWWKDGQGNPIFTASERDFPTHIGDARVFLGDPFNLRDIDCYDYSVGPARDAGLTAPGLLASSHC